MKSIFSNKNFLPNLKLSIYLFPIILHFSASLFTFPFSKISVKVGKQSLAILYLNYPTFLIILICLALSQCSERVFSIDWWAVRENKFFISSLNVLLWIFGIKEFVYLRIPIVLLRCSLAEANLPSRAWPGTCPWAARCPGRVLSHSGKTPHQTAELHDSHQRALLSKEHKG